jgi:hypothetical protein
MITSEISIQRLIRQNIVKPKSWRVKDLAGYLGAVQAQDYSMSKWAFGIRLRGATEFVINEAIDRGEIVRTHVLRPTWHYVSSDDIYWLLDLSSKHLRSSISFRDRQLGLTESIFRKSNAILERSLRDGNSLTRDELAKEFMKENLNTVDGRMSHMLFRAESESLICSGRQKDGKQTYALLPERVPIIRRLSRPESLRELALRYFTSHGPATLRDFAWWSGLSVPDSRKALEFTKDELIFEITGDQTYWFTEKEGCKSSGSGDSFLLPAFDEFLISYRDRTASLHSLHHSKAVSNNGMFFPVIVKDGRVIGTWKRFIKPGYVIIEIDLFNDFKNETNIDIGKAMQQYGTFLQRNTQVIYNSGNSPLYQ